MSGIIRLSRRRSREGDVAGRRRLWAWPLSKIPATSARINELFAAFPGLALRVDHDGRVRSANQVWSPLFEEPPLKGARLVDVVSGGLAEMIRTAMDTAKGKGVGSARFESQLVTARRLWTFGEHLVLINNVELGAEQHPPSESMSDRSAFLASVSHSLRTPLTAVLGYADLLADPETIDDEATRSRLFRTLSEEAWHMAAIFENLLTAARVETDELVTVEVGVDVNANVRQILERMGDTGGDIVTDLHEPSPAIGDPEKVRQVILNLLRNAITHGAPPVLVTSTATENTVVTQVSDHGEGVPSGVADQIFEKFSAGPPKHLGPAGVGIGLWISSLLAARMNGSLSYRRTKGATVFELVLPRYDLTPATDLAVPTS